MYAPAFEGIHIRGGKITRGGIRWSDRKEDYRTEALDLYKTQMAKNTIVVPVGAKGVFYVHSTSNNLEISDYRKVGVACYQNFLRGLLDVTDNLVNNQVVHPQFTIVYDEDSYYLAVAADKGTSTFSDEANTISAAYNFDIQNEISKKNTF